MYHIINDIIVVTSRNSVQKCSVSSAIYVIIIIFLLTICTFMARKLLASD